MDRRFSLRIPSARADATGGGAGRIVAASLVLGVLCVLASSLVAAGPTRADAPASCCTVRTR